MRLLKTISAALTALVLLTSAANADYTACISDVSISGNTLTGARVSMGENKSADFYAAVYENGVLKAVEKAEVSADGNVILNKGITYNSKSQTLKCFLWDDMKPISAVFDRTATGDNEVNGYSAAFVTDEHCSVIVSDTQSFDGNVTENAQTAFARNSDTGEIDTSGEGQVNFMVVPENGYAVDTVKIEPANYKNLKDIGANIYRITKITGDITVTITTRKISEEEKDPSETTGDGIIHLLGDSVNADGVENVTVDGSTVTIAADGEYTVEGTLTDGQIIVGAPKDSLVTVNLNGVSVTSSTGEAFTASNGKITLSAAGENTFISTAESANGIYSKQDLTINGGGKISVTSNGNGIRCKKDLSIGECDLDVNAGNNGIKGDKSVKVTKKNKSITVVSGKDGISSDLAPSIDTDTDAYVSGGTVTINGGNIDITAKSVTDTAAGTTSTGDGIQADTLLTIAGGTINIKADGEALKANASSVADSTPADGNGCIIISGGTITATAGEDGIKAAKSVMIAGGDINIDAAQEGIQVNEIVYDTDGTTVLNYICGEIDITGGTLGITSDEDGIQCGTGNIVISDGEIVVKSQNDGIQAEDLLYITGGKIDITAHGGVIGTKTDESCKGLKSGNLIYITGGDININSYDDAIHSNHTVRILGGSIEAATADDGVHGDYFLFIGDDAYINITASYEGIEATVIYVEGGETYVVSSDDGANAAGDYSDYSISNAYDISDYYDDIKVSSFGEISLFAGPGGNQGNQGNQGNKGENIGNGGTGNKGPDSQGGMDDSSKYGYLNITDGFLYLVADGDVIDSNGSVTMSGGVVMANGPSTNNSNSMFDYDGTFNVTGGTLVGVGIQQTNMDKYPTVSSQGYYSTSKSGSKGDKVKITIGSKNLLIIPATAYRNVFVSTPDMSGTGYSISTVSSYSGGDKLWGKTANGTFYGLIENIN